MSTRITDIINTCCVFQTYLELGVYDSKNFDTIACSMKESVDICGSPTHLCTTDEFFLKNTNKYDIVFIDADHSLQSVVKDFNNAISLTNQMIFLHDMFPPCESFCGSGYCGDSYKLLGYFVDNNIKFVLLDEDCGLCVIFKNDFVCIDVNEVKHIAYQELLNKKIKQTSLQDMKLLIKGYYEK